MKNSSVYRAPLADLRFVIWEQNHLEESLAINYPHLTSALVNRVLEEAAAFAEDVLANSYQQADSQECWMDEQGKVHVPESYPSLLAAFRQTWGERLKPQDQGGLGLPPLVQYAVLEMFMGAHPAFMTYVGFNGPAMQLLTRYGTPEQMAEYVPALSEYRWTSCLCITEAEAGSDLSRIVTQAERQSDGRYLISGEKRFISAGMHSLVDNILYFVLARVKGSPQGMLGLSCFIVPQFDKGKDNQVRCREVVKKMGLKGCANTHLQFGEEGQCYGYLMGGKENIGLVQLLSMMTPARISTGIYALGMASSAYLNALDYARKRIQGKQFDRAMSASAPSLPIIAHPDIRRMLSKMKAQTEGCRAMLGKLGRAEADYHTALQRGEQAAAEQHLAFFELLTPLVKAYCSNEAWNVAENAIQVMGGKGYLSEYPVEQYARDCKVLSIWEGTNHIQAQFLLRDKLGMGVRETHAMRELRARLSSFITKAQRHAELVPLTEALTKTLIALEGSLAELGEIVRQGDLLSLPACANVLMEMVAELIMGWCLVEAAYCARTLNDQVLREGKLATARYFVSTVLSLSNAKAQQVSYLIQTDSVANSAFSWDTTDA
ncbi:acyl-CoA dehydrogenase [Aeromonas hydrophila]|uniref:acyl-CoA dehydrogenase n=1 Tax=Aeromonas hydrophila TaxID=644 RepID=UPI00188F1691|nr:acyl-CoA dehydrogenase [Aeromonas hydrophila]MBF4801473.1 acyl-CoA dehydrogenase [Aeromonas hydrophila]